jgi:hypothetical protein
MKSCQGVKLTTHLHLVQRLKWVELHLQRIIFLHYLHRDNFIFNLPNGNLTCVVMAFCDVQIKTYFSHSFNSSFNPHYTSLLTFIILKYFILNTKLMTAACTSGMGHVLSGLNSEL